MRKLTNHPPYITRCSFRYRPRRRSLLHRHSLIRRSNEIQVGLISQGKASPSTSPVTEISTKPHCLDTDLKRSFEHGDEIISANHRRSVAVMRRACIRIRIKNVRKMEGN